MCLAAETHNRDGRSLDGSNESTSLSTAESLDWAHSHKVVRPEDLSPRSGIFSAAVPDCTSSSLKLSYSSVLRMPVFFDRCSLLMQKGLSCMQGNQALLESSRFSPAPSPCRCLQMMRVKTPGMLANQPAWLHSGPHDVTDQADAGPLHHD